MTLTWTSEHTQTCSLSTNGGEAEPMQNCSGEKTFVAGDVYPPGAYTLVMTAKGLGGEGTCSAEFDVTADSLTTNDLQTLDFCGDFRNVLPRARIAGGKLHIVCANNFEVVYGRFARTATGGQTRWEMEGGYPAKVGPAKGHWRFVRPSISVWNGVPHIAWTTENTYFCPNANGQPQGFHISYARLESGAWQLTSEFTPEPDYWLKRLSIAHNPAGSLLFLYGVVTDWYKLEGAVCRNVGGPEHHRYFYDDPAKGQNVFWDDGQEGIARVNDPYVHVDAAGDFHVVAMASNGDCNEAVYWKWPGGAGKPEARRFFFERDDKPGGICILNPIVETDSANRAHIVYAGIFSHDWSTYGDTAYYKKVSYIRDDGTDWRHAVLYEVDVPGHMNGPFPHGSFASMAISRDRMLGAWMYEGTVHFHFRSFAPPYATHEGTLGTSLVFGSSDFNDPDYMPVVAADDSDGRFYVLFRVEGGLKVVEVHE
jgi:hypothetical protein